MEIELNETELMCLKTILHVELQIQNKKDNEGYFETVKSIYNKLKLKGD